MFNLSNHGEEMVRKREAGDETVLRQPQDRTGNYGNERGERFSLIRECHGDLRAILEKMTIRGHSSVDTDPEGNSWPSAFCGLIENMRAEKTLQGSALG